MTSNRLILAALRYRLKHEGGIMPLEDYRHTQTLIDAYQERLDRNTATAIRQAAARRRPEVKEIP
jgi:hypothetical protein